MSRILPEQTRTVTIFGEHGIINGSNTMMAKPIRALELHYSMIQFLIKPLCPGLNSISRAFT